MADWHETMEKALAEATSGALVTKWMVVAETIDGDGEPQLETMTSLNACHWDQLGMLDYVAAFTRRKIRVTEDE